MYMLRNVVPFRRFSSVEEEAGQWELHRSPVPKPPPDGGWGWVIVFSSFIYNVLVLGFHNSFGVYLISLMETFKESSSKTGKSAVPEQTWVGSISYGFIIIFGPVSGKLTVRYGAREISIAGSIIILISIVCSSLAPSLGVLFFTHGFLTGLGSSFAFTPGMIMVSQYFTTKRSLATGIVMSGGAAGALLQTRLHQYLIDTLGWRQSLRVFSSLMLLCVILGYTYLSLNPKGHSSSVVDNLKNSPLKKFVIDLGLWKDSVFLLWVLANGLCKFGFFIPYVHLVKHAVQLGIPRVSATNIMLVLGVSSMVSRIIFGRICDSDRINRLYFNQASVFFVGLLYLFIPLIWSYGALMAFGLFLGIADAGNYILLPVLTFDLMGAERMPVAWGFMLTVNAVSCLGPPFAGWMNDITGSYNLGFVVAGALNVVACFVLAFIPLARRLARQTRRSIINVTIDNNTHELTEWTSGLPFTQEEPPLSRYARYFSATTFRSPELQEVVPSQTSVLE
ncbi:monocarboxylate transporter 10-like [Colossoma macropomum]|uniref:monocarboxylate transporter 10-like n=1 Tax=Colossoma macropomum TaxID=42526 RepID=UPI0018644906|nr:monocarboxylate transporter 10-like [Colossoma macropomum]